MEMQSSRALPATRVAVWAALNDMSVLRACITGCERLERVDEGRYLITLSAAVGPVKARFNGQLTLADLDPPRSYRLEFDAQGAAAGFGKGTAAVTLHEDESGATLLQYVVKAQVGGRIAQVGSRLVDAAAKKVAADFFDRFERAVATLHAPTTSETRATVPAVAPDVRQMLAWAYVAAAVVAAALAAVAWWARRG